MESVPKSPRSTGASGVRGRIPMRGVVDQQSPKTPEDLQQTVKKLVQEAKEEIQTMSPHSRRRKTDSIISPVGGRKSQMIVQKIVTVPEPHKMKQQNKIKPSPVNDRPIRMITQLPEDMASKDDTTHTPARLDRIVMNTSRNRAY